MPGLGTPACGYPRVNAHGVSFALTNRPRQRQGELTNFPGEHYQTEGEPITRYKNLALGPKSGFASGLRASISAPTTASMTHQARLPQLLISCAFAAGALI